MELHIRTRQRTYEVGSLRCCCGLSRKKHVGKTLRIECPNSGRDMIQHYLRLYQHNGILDFSDDTYVR